MNAAEAGVEPDASAAADTTPPTPGLLENTGALWNDLKGLAHDHLELAALEARRAGESLVSIVVYGVIVGVLAVSAWIGVVAALILWLIALGLAPSLALLAGVLINLVGGVALIFAIRRQSKALRFPATVRALRPGRAAAAVPESQAGVPT
ncbi:MAG: phage holin family protein [Casimicrobiaceae bacterium]